MVGACYVLYGILLFTLIIVQAASALRPFLTSLLSGDKKEGSPKKDDEADGPILDQKKVLQVKEPEVCKYNSQSTPLKHTHFFLQAA
jgi:hypothetical protein